MDKPKKDASGRIWSQAQRRWITSAEPFNGDQQARELIAYMEAQTAPILAERKAAKKRKAGKASAVKRKKTARTKWQAQAIKDLQQWILHGKPIRNFAAQAAGKHQVDAKTIRRWMKTVAP